MSSSSSVISRRHQCQISNLKSSDIKHDRHLISLDSEFRAQTELIIKHYHLRVSLSLSYMLHVPCSHMSVLIHQSISQQPLTSHQSSVIKKSENELRHRQQDCFNNMLSRITRAATRFRWVSSARNNLTHQVPANCTGRRHTVARNGC